MRGLRGHGGPECENLALPPACFASYRGHDSEQSAEFPSLDNAAAFQQRADEGKRHPVSPNEVLIHRVTSLSVPKSFTS